MPRNQKKRNEIMYEDHVNLIRRIAWRFAMLSGIDVEELISEGHLIFMRCIERWDGRRLFSTFLYRCLENGFRTFCFKNDRPRDEEVIILDRAMNPREHLSFKELIASLSDEAKHVAGLLLSGPAEALEILGTEPPKMIRGAIQRYLVGRRGLTHSKSWEVIRELKAIVR